MASLTVTGYVKSEKKGSLFYNGEPWVYLTKKARFHRKLEVRLFDIDASELSSKIWAT